MTFHELQSQALQLTTDQRWHLVQSLLSSLQKEASASSPSKSTTDSSDQLTPWTQSLVGVINLDSTDSTSAYTDYLTEKYS
ncbi:MAG: hypothetical protein AAF329_23375 [Cyanobacteria bacterium P01_A01_bin.17]